MKSIFLFGNKLRVRLLAGVILLCAAFAAYAQSHADSPLPAPTGYVNDYANVVDAGTKAALEKRLDDLKQNTSIEIAVVTVKTTGGQDIFDYSLSVARGWKIGSKEQDNPGLLLLVAIDDHKYFTQVSRDSEGDIPDGVAGQVQRQYLVPAFKAGQYGKGIQDTVEAYIARFGRSRGFDPQTFAKTDGSAAAPVSPGDGANNSTSLLGTCGCLITVLIIIFVIVSFSGAAAARSATRSSWRGGGFGGAGGRKTTAESVASSALPWVIGGILGSMGSGGSSSGGSSDWGGSSGGGGDFGGFGGGGDFGGGGAGGDW
jgi:uncharacterized protein